MLNELAESILKPLWIVVGFKVARGFLEFVELGFGFDHAPSLSQKTRRVRPGFLLIVALNGFGRFRLVVIE